MKNNILLITQLVQTKEVSVRESRGEVGEHCLLSPHLLVKT